jgi:hypothetical protein
LLAGDFMKKILPSLILTIVSGLLILFILFPPNLPPSVPNYVDGNVFCDGVLAKYLSGNPGDDYFFQLAEKIVNVNEISENGETALKCVLYSPYEMDKVAIIKLLISKGADVNIKDKEGETALDCVDDEDEDIKALLIKHGAKSGKDLK